ncbi:MAG: hypothetical protein GX595_20740, partial [Lentisphaerae bacterium]|nr:hypothetical protein [Lentisphaerota bacterium]
LEMRASTGGLNTLAAAKTAAYVGGGDLTTLTQLGEAYAQSNQTEEALNCFRQALDLAEEENPTDAIGVSRIHGLRMTMDDLLRRLGRPRERVDLWQRAAAHAAGEALDGVTSRMLALALADTGEPEAALVALRRAKEPHQDSRASILFATLGDVTAAVDILARARWIEPGRTVTYDREDTALGPGYAAVVRLLALAPPEARQRLLESMVTQLSGLRPAQALRAAMERRRDGPLPTALLHVALDAAVATGDEEAVAALLQDLQNRQPEDLALFNELSAAAVVLSRHGRHQEEAAVAGRALGLGIKGESAEIARTVIRRRLEAQRDGAGRRPAPAGPGFDEAFWQFVTAGGGRVAGDDPDRFILTETGFVTRVRAPRQEVVWQYDLHFRKPFPRRSSPDRKLVLRDAQNGFWITSSAVFACNFLDGVVHALDLATGKPLWTHTEWTTVSPPVVRPQHDTCVCVVNGFGELVILAAADGHLIQRVPAPEKLADNWVENLPDIRVAPVLAPGNKVLWTDWVRVSMNHPTGFYKRNYWSLPGSDPYDAVVTDLNMPGVYSYNMTSGEVRIDDPSLKARPNSADVQPGIASQDTGESLDDILLAARRGDRQKALPALLKILRDPTIDEDTRRRTLYPILDLGGDEGLNAVIDALTDPSYRVRREAGSVLSMARHGSERIPPAALGRLAKIVHEAEESTATSVLYELVGLGGRGIKPLIQDILDDPASPLRTRAALLLAQAGDTSMVPILRPLLRDHLAFGKQREIVETLSALGEPRARQMYLSTIDTVGWLAKAGDTTRRDSLPQDLAQAETLLHDIRRYA